MRSAGVTSSEERMVCQCGLYPWSKIHDKMLIETEDAKNAIITAKTLVLFLASREWNWKLGEDEGGVWNLLRLELYITRKGVFSLRRTDSYWCVFPDGWDRSCRRVFFGRNSVRLSCARTEVILIRCLLFPTVRSGKVIIKTGTCIRRLTNGAHINSLHAGSTLIS